MITEGNMVMLTPADLQDAIFALPGLAVDAVAEKFQIGTPFPYRINGQEYNKAAATGIDFTGSQTINTGTAAGDFWGVFAVVIDAAGAITTVVPSADQVYTSEALAIAALPAAPADKVRIGYITIQANTDSAWTSVTDDLTPESDVAAVNFYDETVGGRVLLHGRRHFTHLRWTGMTDAGHTVELANERGVSIWERKASTTLTTEKENLVELFPRGIDGLKMISLGSGKLYLYQRI